MKKKIFIISSTLRFGPNSTLEQVLRSFSLLFGKKYELNFFYENLLLDKNNYRNLLFYLLIYKKKYTNIIFYNKYDSFYNKIKNNNDSIIIFYEGYNNFNFLDFSKYYVIILGNIFKLFSWSTNSIQGDIKLLEFNNLKQIFTFSFTKFYNLTNLNIKYFSVENNKIIYTIHTPCSIPYFYNNFSELDYKFDILILLGTAIDYDILDKFLDKYYLKFKIGIIGKYEGNNHYLLKNQNITYFGFIDISKRKIISFLIKKSKIIFIPLKEKSMKKTIKYINTIYKMKDNEFIRIADSLLFGKLVITKRTYITDIYKKGILATYKKFSDIENILNYYLSNDNYLNLFYKRKKYYYVNNNIGTIIGKLVNFIKFL